MTRSIGKLIYQSLMVKKIRSATSGGYINSNRRSTQYQCVEEIEEYVVEVDIDIPKESGR